MKLSNHERRKLTIKGVPSKHSNDFNYARIIDEYTAGKSMNRLAFENGTNDGHIRRILQANNIAVRNQKAAARIFYEGSQA